jgi:hypothetical protein
MRLWRRRHEVTYHLLEFWRLRRVLTLVIHSDKLSPMRNKRPPKPEGIPSSPRRKNRGRMNGLRAIKEALSALTKGAPQEEHLLEIEAQANAENNDRGAAILAATNLENALSYAIEAKLKPSESQYDELFGMGGPVGTFSNKIILAHALGLFGPDTRHNLELVRSIRNTFAHARIPVVFETEAIKQGCSLFILPRLFEAIRVRMPLDPGIPETNPRRQFQLVCERTAHNLSFISMPMVNADIMTSDPLHSSASISRMPRALP